MGFPSWLVQRTWVPRAGQLEHIRTKTKWTYHRSNSIRPTDSLISEAWVSFFFASSFLSFLLSHPRTLIWRGRKLFTFLFDLFAKLANFLYELARIVTQPHSTISLRGIAPTPRKFRSQSSKEQRPFARLDPIKGRRNCHQSYTYIVHRNRSSARERVRVQRARKRDRGNDYQGGCRNEITLRAFLPKYFPYSAVGTCCEFYRFSFPTCFIPLARRFYKRISLFLLPCKTYFLFSGYIDWFNSLVNPARINLS